MTPPRQILYGQLVPGGESVVAVMTALRAVLERHGLPMALYTDRARWAAYTPTSGTNPDRSKLTQVGRALHRLGIEHILGYSPQARGRSERVNRTLQDRLVNELRVAGIHTVPGANRYLHERFLPTFNTEFGRPPTDPTPAFVPLGRCELEQILCHEEERVVGLDNTVRLDGVVLQLAKQRGRDPQGDRRSRAPDPPRRRGLAAVSSCPRGRQRLSGRMSRGRYNRRADGRVDREAESLSPAGPRSSSRTPDRSSSWIFADVRRW